MKKLRYVLYDNQSGINTNELKVDEFEFDNNTLCGELYKELMNKYYPKVEYEISFLILDNYVNNRIDETSCNIKFKDVLNFCNLDSIVIIYSVLPIGGEIANYHGYKLYIHSDEEIHRNLPHVHIKCGGEETRINLLTLEIMDDDIFNSRKDKKKVMSYLKDNQEKWINYYNDVVIEGKSEHMKIEKII